MKRAFDQPGRSPVIASSAAAATSHPLATATALAVLREGGNAVDAAIAASATLCVVEPHMTGVGGDCFALLREPDGRIFGLNGSGRAPAGLNPGWFHERKIARIDDRSPHAITVPGAVKAWEELHGRFGRMDFAPLFADAVRHAREGFAVHARVASDWATLEEKLLADAGARRHLLKDGRAPEEGDRMRFPALANVLEAIARDGSAAIYSGAIAAEIAATVSRAGGFLSEEDLAGATADWVDPVSAEFAGRDVIELPPNGQGITALILLRLMEQIGMPEDANSGARHFHQIELARLAYGVRDAHVADPASMTATSDMLLDKDFIRRLGSRFDPEQRVAVDLPPAPLSDTIYLCVVDSDLRAVSFINSVYSGFGTGITTPESGITLQNRGSCFTLEEGHPNCLAPGKRPMHTIIPGLATQGGRLSATFGVMGGSYQPTGHAHVLSNMWLYGMDPQQALDHPRLFWDDAGMLMCESGIGEDVRDYLRARSHGIGPGGPFGGGQVIVADHERGFLIAASDPRKDGQAGGF